MRCLASIIVRAGAFRAFLIAIAVFVTVVAPVNASPDAVYAGAHPRLLFTNDELPALRAKVGDGGYDDDAYAFIRNQYLNVYTGSTWEELLDIDFAMEQMVNLGLATYLEDPIDTGARELGRALTLHIAAIYNVDTDAYYSALRLRALVFGYDMFFGAASEAERDYVRGRIRDYVDYMVTNINYDIWRHPPYTSNKTAMVCAALGLAWICIADEEDPGYIQAVRTKTDQFFDAWREAHLDPDGSYNEGALYGVWSMRHLIYYMHARKRHDGVDYAQLPEIRAMADWLAYELSPRGGGHVNNMQDCTTFHLPLARHNTYFDWAQSAWGSPLAGYLWEHTAGPYGYDHLDEADKAATVLFNQGLAPQNPRDLLPESIVWEYRGLYYYRDDWPDAGGPSDDVVFSFYSGPFQGGHAQEDQNQFTLAAYGEQFAVDHGAGPLAQQSEAHNMVLIDGAGQHYAGSSIGTDGNIAAYVRGGFADYVMGDATAAYTTYSPLNAAGVPYPGIDWSWGYIGANPVERAHRHVIAVRDPASPPYFIVHDDIRKDATPREYEWRLHTGAGNVVSLSQNPLRITGTNAAMDVHLAYPDFNDVTVASTYFDNGNGDPNSELISVTTTAINPYFTFILMPRETGTPVPLATSAGTQWGTVTSIVWPTSGAIDVVVLNTSGSPISTALSQALPDGSAGGMTPGGRARWGAGPRGSAGSSSLVTPEDGIDTDARLVVIRMFDGQLAEFIVAGGTFLTAFGIEWVRSDDGPLNVSFDGALYGIDRADAAFTLYAGAATGVVSRGADVPFIDIGGFFVPVASATPEAPAVTGGIHLNAYPNPFSASAAITLDAGRATRATVAVFDAAGRRVAVVHNGPLRSGRTRLSWDGRDGRGATVPAGVYFLRARTPAHTVSRKITVLR